MKSVKLLVLFALLVLVAVVPGASAVPRDLGGGDSGIDILPMAIIDVDGSTSLVTVDGTNWSETTDSDAAALLDAASVTALVDDGNSTFWLVGSGAVELEAGVLATLASMPSAAFNALEPTASGTHPTPSRDEYKLKKTIITSKGTEKEIFKTLVVEKRGGEPPSEFQKRSERELRDAMDAGWESVG